MRRLVCCGLCRNEDTRNLQLEQLVRTNIDVLCVDKCLLCVPCSHDSDTNERISPFVRGKELRLGAESSTRRELLMAPISPCRSIRSFFWNGSIVWSRNHRFDSILLITAHTWPTAPLFTKHEPRISAAYFRTPWQTAFAFFFLSWLRIRSSQFQYRQKTCDDFVRLCV